MLADILAKHKEWLADNTKGERADLQNASLQYANLHGANLDFSCWPLHCGSLDAKVDKRIAAQLAYHFCRLDCPEIKKQQAALKDLANTFHRVEECGRVK